MPEVFDKDRLEQNRTTADVADSSAPVSENGEIPTVLPRQSVSDGGSHQTSSGAPLDDKLGNAEGSPALPKISESERHLALWEKQIQGTEKQIQTLEEGRKDRGFFSWLVGANAADDKALVEAKSHLGELKKAEKELRTNGDVEKSKSEFKRLSGERIEKLEKTAEENLKVLDNADTGVVVAEGVRNAAVFSSAMIASGGAAGAVAGYGVIASSAAGVTAGAATGGAVGVVTNATKETVHVQLGNKTKHQAIEDFKTGTIQDAKSGAIAGASTLAGLGASAKVAGRLGELAAQSLKGRAMIGASAGFVGAETGGVIGIGDAVFQARNEFNEKFADTNLTPAQRQIEYQNFMEERGLNATAILKSLAQGGLAGALGGAIGGAGGFMRENIGTTGRPLQRSFNAYKVAELRRAGKYVGPGPNVTLKQGLVVAGEATLAGSSGLAVAAMDGELSKEEIVQEVSASLFGDILGNMSHQHVSGIERENSYGGGSLTSHYFSFDGVEKGGVRFRGQESKAIPGEPPVEKVEILANDIIFEARTGKRKGMDGLVDAKQMLREVEGRSVHKSAQFLEMAEIERKAGRLEDSRATLAEAKKYIQEVPDEANGKFKFLSRLATAEALVGLPESQATFREALSAVEPGLVARTQDLAMNNPGLPDFIRRVEGLGFSFQVDPSQSRRAVVDPIRKTVTISPDTSFRILDVHEGAHIELFSKLETELKGTLERDAAQRSYAEIDKLEELSEMVADAYRLAKGGGISELAVHETLAVKAEVMDFLNRGIPIEDPVCQYALDYAFAHWQVELAKIPRPERTPEQQRALDFARETRRELNVSFEDRRAITEVVRRSLENKGAFEATEQTRDFSPAERISESALASRTTGTDSKGFNVVVRDQQTALEIINNVRADEFVDHLATLPLAKAIDSIEELGDLASLAMRDVRDTEHFPRVYETLVEVMDYGNSPLLRYVASLEFSALQEGEIGHFPMLAVDPDLIGYLRDSTQSTIFGSSRQDAIVKKLADDLELRRQVKIDLPGASRDSIYVRLASDAIGVFTLNGELEGIAMVDPNLLHPNSTGVVYPIRGRTIEEITRDPRLLPFDSTNPKDTAETLDLLHSLGLRNHIEIDLGISFTDMPLRSQIHFLNYLKTQDKSGFEKLNYVIQNHSESANTILRSFLANAEDSRYADRIIDLAERLDDRQASAVFSKYVEIAEAVDGIRDFLAVQAHVENPTDVQLTRITRDLLHRANSILEDTARRVTERSLSALETEEVVNRLDRVNADLALTASAIKGLGTDSPIRLSDIEGVSIETLPASQLSFEDRIRMIAISKENSERAYPTESYRSWVQHGLVSALTDPVNSFYVLRKNGEILSYVRTKPSGTEDGRYIASFNTDPFLRAGNIGFELFERALMAEGEKEIVGVTYSGNPALARYRAMGFEVEPLSPTDPLAKGATAEDIAQAVKITKRPTGI